MAIELELPADMDSSTGVMDSTDAADQAVGLLEAESESADETTEAIDETTQQEQQESGHETETEPATSETIAPPAETIETVTVETVQVGETVVVSPPKPSPQEIAQAAWKQRIRDISDELAEAALERLEAESRFKAAKNREKSIVEQLSEVMKEGPQILPLFDQQQQPTSSQVAAESVAPDSQTWQEAGQPVAPVIIAPLTDDAWRSVRLAELNLKPKLQERLEEAGVDTIGRLEDLRAEISQGREKWPKGIGKAKITEIKDAVITWLSKNRDAQVLAEAQAQATEIALNSLADFSERSEEPQEFDPCGRAVELDNDNIEELDPRHPDGPGCWQSGRDAWNQDAQVSECPYVAGPEADDWIRGWLSASKLDSISKSQPYREPSIDDL